MPSMPPAEARKHLADLVRAGVHTFPPPRGSAESLSRAASYVDPRSNGDHRRTRPLDRKEKPMDRVPGLPS
jgi:hypothetical protein